MDNNRQSHTLGLQVDLAAGINIGQAREVQEDAVYVPDRALEQSDYDQGVLLVVADGVGGLRAGNEASYLAVTVIAEVFEQEWTPDVRATLAQAVAKANTTIYRHGREFRRDKMATTVVCGVIQRNLLYLAHVGDSRAYCLRQGQLIHLTKDHSFVQALIDAGELTEEAARTHPQRHRITRSLGLEPQVEVELTVVPLRDGDRILLCSDGLYELVSEASMIQQLQKPPQLTCDELIRLANEAGGTDNITAIVAAVSYKESGHKEHGQKGDSNSLISWDDESTDEITIRYDDDTSEHSTL